MCRTGFGTGRAMPDVAKQIFCTVINGEKVRNMNSTLLDYRASQTAMSCEMIGE